MKRYFFGVLLGISAFTLYNNSEAVYNRLVGPTVQHRQDGVLTYTNNSFHAIDPKTKLIVDKTFGSGESKTYLDITKDQDQYVTWKENNFCESDIEFHVRPEVEQPVSLLDKVIKKFEPKVEAEKTKETPAGVIAFVLFSLICALVIICALIIHS